MVDKIEHIFIGTSNYSTTEDNRISPSSEYIKVSHTQFSIRFPKFTEVIAQVFLHPRRKLGCSCYHKWLVTKVA